MKTREWGPASHIEENAISLVGTSTNFFEETPLNIITNILKNIIYNKYGDRAQEIKNFVNNNAATLQRVGSDLQTL